MRRAFLLRRRPKMAKEVILTKEGYEKLKQEIEYLSTDKRREVAERARLRSTVGASLPRMTVLAIRLR